MVHFQWRSHIIKGWRSANTFLKSGICKFADLNNLFDCGLYTNVALFRYAILRFVDPIFFADLKPPQVRKYIFFLLTHTAYNALIQTEQNKNNLFKEANFRTVLRQSCAVLYFVEIFGFADYFMKICDLRFADWHTQQILRICKSRISLSNLPT
jgi:hypothetical protein